MPTDSLKDCQKVADAFPDVWEYCKKYPTEFRQVIADLRKTPNGEVPAGHNRKTCRILTQRTYLIDALSRKERDEAQATEGAVSDKTQARIDEIKADPVWLNRSAKGHRELHREYVNLITGRAESSNGDGETNGET